tara:strand:- start:4189 stop:4905 length:717 start_codon:yes stop_codon:yes gene_type:complete
MAKSAKKLEWCEVRLGKDMNWWVEKISDPIHWDLDSLSIVDPRQMAHILDVVYPLREYGLNSSIIDNAFFKFRIEKDLGKGHIRLARIEDSILDSDEPLFGLPDILDEEKGPYADFIDHITKLRVKMLNDLIEFEQRLTVDELEDEIREDQNNAFMEGKAIHIFDEIMGILEYVPHGYELDDEEISSNQTDEDYEDDIPDIEEEDIEEDDTMKWEDEETEEVTPYNPEEEGIPEDVKK